MEVEVLLIANLSYWDLFTISVTTYEKVSHFYMIQTGTRNAQHLDHHLLKVSLNEKGIQHKCTSDGENWRYTPTLFVLYGILDVLRTLFCPKLTPFR